jgi:hypothetical protein
MRSRCCSGLGRPSGDTKASGRRVTRKAPSAHVEGGSGRSEASPTAILQDTHSVEESFSEVRIRYPAYRRSYGARIALDGAPPRDRTRQKFARWMDMRVRAYPGENGGPA